MRAEIIAVGSELLTPQRIDTNSLYLTDQLNALGVEVILKTVVGDDRDRCAEVIRHALRRSEVVVLTGGLGPTEDDVTRDAVAAALQRRQHFRQDICDGIEARFQRMNRKMAEINKRQAMVVDGAEVLANECGTAPGLWIQDGGRIVMLLPGPPGEMKPLFERECVPRLQRLLPAQVLRTRIYRIAGLPESEVDQRVAPVYARYSNPVTTILAAPGDIQIHLRARCDTAEAAERLLEELGSQIEALLGDRIYARNGDSLESVVGSLLRRRGATLSVAESCTGGMLAQRITSVSGSSSYFSGGFVTYTDAMKTALLGVDPALLRQHTAVSEPAALALANAVRDRTGTSFAISITGLAGPEGGTEQSPIGTVWIGLAAPDGTSARSFRFLGDRERIRTLAVQTALDGLRMKLTQPER